MQTKEQLINAIDACLPQTQCGLCAYTGCRPYATAIINQGESIDRCLPGGVAALNEIAQLTGLDAAPYQLEMQQKAKVAAVAVVREAECIGCTKCIQACPVDAIIGAAKLMHTIITDACTGCELCIPVCPVDCIDLVPIAEPELSLQRVKAQQSRQRYQQRLSRLSQQQQEQQQSHQLAKLQQDNQRQTLSARQIAITAAVARAQTKKSRVLV